MLPVFILQSDIKSTMPSSWWSQGCMYKNSISMYEMLNQSTVQSTEAICAVCSYAMFFTATGCKLVYSIQIKEIQQYFNSRMQDTSHFFLLLIFMHLMQKIFSNQNIKFHISRIQVEVILKLCSFKSLLQWIALHFQVIMFKWRMIKSMIKSRTNTKYKKKYS